MSDSEIEKEWTEMKEEIFGTKEAQEKLDAENKEIARREYERAINTGGFTREIAVAAKMAKEGMKSDGLSATRDEYGEWTYTAKQGAMAACYAREDAAATLILQATQLKHLHDIKILLYGCICLLAYIAYKFH
ncbi:MAG: hypothetical protein ABL858_05540 [Candidatus Nitrotoga sp.]